MKFSIVTISFNQAQFLERAIKSVVDQKGVELDYIVVDPGSTDGSRDIIEAYRGRIATVIYERDKGPADGLNKGFAAAAGDVLGYLNSDDFYLPGAFRTVADFFGRHPDTDIGVGRGFIVDAHGRATRTYRSPPFDARRFAYGHSNVLQQSTFFRRRAYEKSGGFNIANRTSWDGELYLTMALQGAGVKVIPAYLASFTIHPGSITGSGATEAESRRNHERYFEMVMGRRRTNLDLWYDRLALAHKFLADPADRLARLRDATIGPRAVHSRPPQG